MQKQPQHYKTTIDFDVIDFCQNYSIPFTLGNAIKYLCRAGKKEGELEIKDLQKASIYIDREINLITKKWPIADNYYGSLFEYREHEYTEVDLINQYGINLNKAIAILKILDFVTTDKRGLSLDHSIRPLILAKSAIDKLIDTPVKGFSGHSGITGSTGTTTLSTEPDQYEKNKIVADTIVDGILQNNQARAKAIEHIRTKIANTIRQSTNVRPNPEKSISDILSSNSDLDIEKVHQLTALISKVLTQNKINFDPINPTIFPTIFELDPEDQSLLIGCMTDQN
jgi:hypothetical protein